MACNYSEQLFIGRFQKLNEIQFFVFLISFCRLQYSVFIELDPSEVVYLITQLLSAMQADFELPELFFIDWIKTLVERKILSIGMCSYLVLIVYRLCHTAKWLESVAREREKRLISSR